jgi:hypothetical protein
MRSHKILFRIFFITLGILFIKIYTTKYILGFSNLITLDIQPKLISNKESILFFYLRIYLKHFKYIFPNKFLENSNKNHNLLTSYLHNI